jgi:hypothetical protein
MRFFCPIYKRQKAQVFAVAHLNTTYLTPLQKIPSIKMPPKKYPTSINIFIEVGYFLGGILIQGIFCRGVKYVVFRWAAANTWAFCPRFWGIKKTRRILKIWRIFMP